MVKRSLIWRDTQRRVLALLFLPAAPAIMLNFLPSAGHHISPGLAAILYIFVLLAALTSLVTLPQSPNLIWHVGANTKHPNLYKSALWLGLVSLRLVILYCWVALMGGNYRYYALTVNGTALAHQLLCFMAVCGMVMTYLNADMPRKEKIVLTCTLGVTVIVLQATLIYFWRAY